MVASSSSFPLLAALVLTACASPTRAAHVTRSSEDVRYAGTPPTRDDPRIGDVYRPTGEGPLPAVVLIHGGSWQTRLALGAWRAWRAASRVSGYVVLQRRLSARARAPLSRPSSTTCATAFRWLHAHARSFVGRSGPDRRDGLLRGAHLALLLALAEPGDGFGPRAVVAGAPPHRSDRGIRTAPCSRR